MLLTIPGAVNIDGEIIAEDISLTITPEAKQASASFTTKDGVRRNIIATIGRPQYSMPKMTVSLNITGIERLSRKAFQLSVEYSPKSEVFIINGEIAKQKVTLNEKSVTTAIATVIAIVAKNL